VVDLSAKVVPPPLSIDGRVCADVALHHVWNTCLGAGRANEALRADWQHHFREAVDVLGVRYVRFHGLFHDDMFVYRGSYGSGFGPDNPLPEPLHTFSYVDKVFDFVLEAGARPFVELGFMPRELATRTETLFWWKAHCSPPKDIGRWADLITATVRHWVERYGPEEVRQWRFEVWNEPNLVPHFWTGTRTEYFELYEATAWAVKSVDPGLKVGGPSTSVFVPDGRYQGEYEDRRAQHATATAEDVDALDWRPIWIEELIDWCAGRDVPLDFLSTHLYPTDLAFGADGRARHIHRHADATMDDLESLRKIIARSRFPDAELHITEWSTSPSSRDRMHDTVFAATYITRAFLRCAALADSISYWTFTDVFEEGGAGIGPFHGGFGLVNEQGIHKPTFHALAMLARLGDRLLASTPHGVVTRHSSTGALAGIFYNFPDDPGPTPLRAETTYEDTRDRIGYGPSRSIRHTVSPVPPGATFRVETLDWNHGNVAEAWHRMGEPLNLTRAQEAELRRTADELGIRTLTASDQGTLELELDLPPWAVTSVVEVRPATPDGATDPGAVRAKLARTGPS
jgi:xylan 1,4-beta-xylosidase